MKLVRIQTGGLYVSAEHALVRTVLGSCVAACVFDPEVGVGGMNHFMLPGGCDACSMPSRYGAHAMDELLSKIVALGGKRARLRAKLFGAAHVLKLDAKRIQVPYANAKFAREYLAEAHIPIVGHQLGGSRPLDVSFETHTGAARVRAFGWDSRDSRDEILRREAEFAESLRDLPPKSVVTVF